MEQTELQNELAELNAPDDDVRRDPVGARKKAMDLLARREQTRGELITKLVKARFAVDIAEDVVSQLGTEGLQSDQRFAEAFVQSRYRSGKGPARVRAELRGKSVPDALIDSALSDFDGNWYALAVDVRAKKFGTAPASDFKEKARQMRFLQYRGFESDHIAVACGED
ncbi:MAG: regulatory protein RecX [Pseudomonadota bacterium]